MKRMVESRRRLTLRALFTGLAGGCVAALTLSACMSLAGGSSSTETGDKVALNGRVTGGAGDGIAGVVVTLKGSALADTTDITGHFALSGRRPATGGSADTLRFAINGQTVTHKAITALTGNLPDVMIVQRGFSGSFSGSAANIGRIEGVLKGDGIAAGDSVTATFFFNTLAGNYSGFIWFPPPTETARNYTVRIDVYNSEGTLMGRGPDVPFNSLAGNVVIPEFNPASLAATPAKRAAVSLRRHTNINNPSDMTGEKPLRR